MRATVDKSAIQEVYTSVTAHHKSDDAVDQEKLINSFLDSILALRKFLDHKSQIIEDIEQSLVNLTYVDRDTLNEDDNIHLRELITVAREYYSVLMRFYAQIRVVREQGGIRQEAARFKEAAALLKETTEDLELAFFMLPATDDFQDTQDRLGALLP